MKIIVTLSVFVLVFVLGVSQAAEAASSQRKSAQAMLESIKQALMSEKGAAAGDFIKHQNSEDDGANLLVQENGDDDKLLMQLDDDSLLKGQFSPDAGMAGVPGVPKSAAKAEGLTDDSDANIQGRYVRIPYYMWRRVWVYYYYVYYRNYALRIIRG